MASSKCSIFGILMLILIIIAAAAADKYLKVGFEVEPDDLDVTTLDSDGYIAFHDKLRTKLKARDIGTGTNKVAVLPTDDQKNPQWFDLKLTGYKGARTTVRFRVGNLYVVGYLATSRKPAVWFELGDPNKGDKKHWIPDSQFLGFRGDYIALGKAAGKSVTEISLSQGNFAKAVQTLASSTKGSERAEALMLVAVMVSEACRFVELSNDFAVKLQSSFSLQEWMLQDLMREWSTYSEYLLCHNQFPNYKFPKPTINKIVILKADDLRKKLGILLNVQIDKKKCGIKITGNDVELPNVIDFQAQVQNPVELVGGVEA